MRFYLTIFIFLFQFSVECSNEQNQIIDKMTANIERKYDAYEKMLEHNKLDLFIVKVAYHLERHLYQPIPYLPDPTRTHPTNFDRTKMGLEILQAHGYNIAELMQNLPEGVASGIKKHLPGAVKTYFPEFLK